MAILTFLVTLTWSGSTLQAADQPVPPAAVVFKKHFDAVGGRAALEAIKTMKVKGVGQEGEGTLQFEFSFSVPGKILFVGSINGEVLVRMGRDREARCWRQDPSGVHDLDGAKAGELMDLALSVHLPALLGLSDLLQDAVTELDKTGDSERVAIGRAGAKTAFPRLLFDRASGRLAQVGELRVGDYRLVDGLQVPHRITAPKQTVFQIEAVQLNPTLSDDVFDRPQGKTTMPAGLDRAPSLVLTNSLSAPGKLEIVRRPVVANFGRGEMLTLPAWNPGSARHAQVDLRGYDLRRLDLRDHLTNLLHADFDSRTRWPEQVPAGFDRERILALGRDPGLGVRELHKRGITGRGIGIGIIDQPLLVDHVEYADRLRLYEEIHSPAGAPAQMHGPAVASIAVGRSMGVAPEAELYYIAEQHGIFRPGGGFDWDFTPLAQSIDRLLEVNATLPPDRRIRVISISVGWSPQQKGYEAATASVKRADQAGVFVVSTAIEDTHQLKFHGLGRDALGDPNDFKSYGPGSWWGHLFWGGQHQFKPGERLLVPMDCRALASPTGPEDSVFYWSAGWSWSVPWIAGLYALACQVDPEITPSLFWNKALDTGRTIRIKKDTLELDFGTIADPIRLIESLQATRSH